MGVNAVPSKVYDAEWCFFAVAISRLKGCDFADSREELIQGFAMNQKRNVLLLRKHLGHSWGIFVERMGFLKGFTIHEFSILLRKKATFF